MSNPDELLPHNNSDMAPSVSRRDFLLGLGAAGTGLWVAGQLGGLRVIENLLVDPAEAAPSLRLPESSPDPYTQTLINARYWDIKTYQQILGIKVSKQAEKIGPLTRPYIDRREGLEFSTTLPGRVIDVNTDKQILTYFDNGKPRLICRISSGKEQPWEQIRPDGQKNSGEAITPTGVFKVVKLEGADYYSSIFGPEEGKMPWAIKLGSPLPLKKGQKEPTYRYRGIALHEGFNPGQPASHGCVRLGLNGVAPTLQTMGITVGDTVIINGSAKNFRAVYL